MQQTLLTKKELKYVKRAAHGGDLAKGKRKTKRPLVPGATIHTILKSTKAKGTLSFLKHQAAIESLLKERARKFHIEIRDFVIMKNHLHLKTRFKSSIHFQNFLRTFTGLLARKLTKAHRGVRFGKFWDDLAYTRVLFSKLEAYGLKNYFIANLIEKQEGYAARERFLDKANASLYRLRTRRSKNVTPL